MSRDKMRTGGPSPVSATSVVPAHSLSQGAPLTALVKFCRVSLVRKLWKGPSLIGSWVPKQSSPTVHC